MMDMTFRPMLPAEQNYTYTQSQQISMQTGCIGHLSIMVPLSRPLSSNLS
jgi:hypothetical protein